MNGLRLAISFLTVLPVALHNMPYDLASARAYFPLVGLMLGGALAGIDLALQALFPSLLNGAVLVVMLIVLTGALHIEGFMDACDSLLGGYTQERRLEILHDPHIGAFAVVGGVSLLLLKWTAVVSLPVSIRAPLLVLFPCLSRWGMLIDMEVYPYARLQGMGIAFQQSRNRWQVAVGFATTFIASLLLAGAAGVLLLAVATALALGLGRWMAGLLGGLTGDTYGTVNETTEVVVLLVGIAVEAMAPSMFLSPLSWGG